MRKTLLVIATLLFTAQVFAVTVTIEVNDIGDGWAAIRYSADANVSAFGLKVTADSGAIFTDINDYNVGECTASVQGYGIFPGTIDINETTGLVDGNGTPIAPSWDPCDHVGPTGLDTNTLILEMGALYADDSCQPDQNGTLIKVKVDQSSRVCVEGEPTRGNIVMTDGTAVEANDCEYIQTDCFYVGMVDGCGYTVTAADVAMWNSVLVNKAPCWCYPCHCRGDVDDDCTITGTDIQTVVNAWPNAPKFGPYNPCSDTDYDGAITGTDIQTIVNAWPNAPKFGPGCSGVTGCP